MKRILTAVALGALLVGGAAQAADLPSRKAPPPVYVPPPPPPLWTGFYAGLNLGGAWSANSGYSNMLVPYADPLFPIGGANLFFLPSASAAGNAGGVVGGGQIGYNYQFGTSILLGAEADFQGTSISNSQNGYSNIYASPLTPGGVLIPLANAYSNVSLPWFGTVRGRLGYLITPTLLIYGTGGFAYGGVTLGPWSTTLTGWTAGGGVEWMFMPNWSAKVEYLYTALNSGFNTGYGYGYGLGGGYNHGPQLNVVRAGLNYHFNWGAPAPVVAKY